MKKILLATIAALGLATAAYAAGINLPSPAIVQGHMIVQGSPPTVSGGTLVSGSSDFAGEVIATGITAVTVTFNKAFTAAPFCTATDNTTAAAIKAVNSATALTITGQSASDHVGYICVGRPVN